MRTSMWRPYYWLLLAAINVVTASIQGSLGNTGWFVLAASMAAGCGLMAGMAYHNVQENRRRISVRAFIDGLDDAEQAS